MKTLRIGLVAAALIGAEHAAATQILPDRPFVIGSTYWGGSSTEDYAAVATDPAGNTYVAIGGADVTVSKFDALGRLVSVATYGGSASEAVSAIAVDAAGRVVIVGSTISSDLPTVNPIQPAFHNSGCSEFGGTCADGFVARIDPATGQVLFASYLGTLAGQDIAKDVAVDAQNNIYVVGESVGGFANLPSVRAPAGGLEAFVGKIPPAGRVFTYLTYLGGSFDDSGNGIAVDAAGNAYVTGNTGSSDFPTRNPIQAGRENFSNYAFVTKLGPGGAIVYSTYLGGNAEDYGQDIAVDSLGQAVVVGSTGSTNFPLMNPAQPFLRGFNDAFVAKLAASGSSLMFSTYLGGNERERAGFDFSSSLMKLAVDAAGNAYVTGMTRSPDFPALFPVQPYGGGVCVELPDFTPFPCSDAFLSKFDRNGRLLFSTTIGGSREERGRGLALGPNGIVYVAGITRSADFPVRLPIQGSLSGSSDAFITKISTAPPVCQLPAPVPVAPSGGVFESQPAFSWQAVAGAEVYAATAVNTAHAALTGTPPVQVIGVTAGTSVIPAAPFADGDYTWRVTAWNRICGWGATSQPASFTLPGTCPAPTALLVSPINGAAANNPTTYRWTTPGPAVAALSVVLITSGGRFVAQYPALGNSFTAPIGLSTGDYTWYVLTWSSTCGFTASAPATYRNTGGTQ